MAQEFYSWTLAFALSIGLCESLARRSPRCRGIESGNMFGLPPGNLARNVHDELCPIKASAHETLQGVLQGIVSGKFFRKYNRILDSHGGALSKIWWVCVRGVSNQHHSPSVPRPWQ